MKKAKTTASPLVNRLVPTVVAGLLMISTGAVAVTALAAGVSAERLVLVVNRCPKRGSTRAETARTISELLLASHPGETVLGPVFVPERKQLDAHIRDVAPLPDAMVEPVTAAVRARLDATDHVDASPLPGDEPVPVEVGTLGAWDEEVAG